MIRNAAAWIFRTINSKITTTNSTVLRKILKVTVSVSSLLSATFRYPKDEEIEITNFDSDLRLTINPSRSMGNAIYWTGFHEVKELIFLHHFLTPDMVFFDIGANQGEYTVFAAKRIPGGQVFSFEPLPRMQKLLSANVGLNGFENVTVLPYGLSDKNTVMPIVEVKDRHEGLATLYPGERASAGQYLIDLKVADDEAKNLHLSRLDFIKIDIEGGELPALKGARKLITEFQPYVMVEINDETYQLAGYASDAVLAFFQSLNYLPFRLDRNAILQGCSRLPAFGNIIFKPA